GAERRRDHSELRGGDHRRAGLDRRCRDRRADRGDRPRRCGASGARCRAVHHLSRDGRGAGLPSGRPVRPRPGAQDLTGVPLMSTRSAVLRPLGVAALVVAALAAAGLALPSWLLFLATMAIAHAVVALGLVFMMRGGLVSFGQGLPFCLGAYAAGLAGP